MISEETRQVRRYGKQFEDQLRPSANGCIEWAGRVDKYGYGVRGSRYGERRAHRHAYHLANGAIPPGAIIRHQCDNPLCCNPDHLTIGTMAENIQDKVVRSRQAVGRKIRTTKMTEETVLEIRKCSAEGLRQVDIAERFGLDQTTVSQIVLRKTWKYI